MCKACGNNKLYNFGTLQYCSRCDLFQKVTETVGGLMVVFYNPKGDVVKNDSK